MNEEMINLLDTIKSPDDLKKISKDKLIQVSNELRQFIIDIVSENPGHFGASLGVVELTVALHYVYNTPYDRIVWDVGHQAYGHKILTGRKDIFHTNRKYKGISGFPNRFESEYDAFGVGHSSTSISAALGMAKAAKLKGEIDRNIVAVIGDGSMTAGLAFEGLNNAGIENSNILVVLNDNHMAIDPNVGALNEYLLDITTSKTYNKLKEEVWHLLGKLKKIGPNTQQFVQKVEGGLKSILLKQSNLFESLNFRYFGPVDGHDVEYLVSVLNDLKDIPGPKLLHVLTKKGKGFKQAELNQTQWHAPGLFNKNTGELIKVKSDKPQAPKFQDVFGHTLLELAEKNDKIIGITPAMPSGSSLNIMMEKIPERAFDVGIAEQHAVTFSAGLAAEGMMPFCNIYSSFMQRAYDQVIHDVALQNLNVVFCLDRGGIVGSDGATHHGAFDLAYMRCIPNMIVSSPMNEQELRNLMYTAQLPNRGPFVIRYPRGKGTMPNWETEFKEIEIGKARTLKEGNDVAVLSIGAIGNNVSVIYDKLDKEGIDISHYDMRFVKPLDENLLHKILKKFDKLITVEDGTVVGGFGSSILEFMSKNNYSAKVKMLGIPDRFIEHGTQQELYAECNYDSESIYLEIIKISGLKNLSNKSAVA
ncbi:MAG: 1-deoxy-D-xylulose-5-phosphate synthase [Bacteroidales bacterium]|nr:1-deoxy-D-xylulose-5-phosphate synthase [Bacteroidales bacterium]